MADLRPIQTPGAPNILGAFQTGANIAAQRQRQNLLQQQYDAAQSQLALENKRLAEAAAERADELEYTNASREVELYGKLGLPEKQHDAYRRAIKVVSGQDLPPDYPIEQEDIDLLIKRNAEKDPKKQAIIEDEIVDRTGKTSAALSVIAEKRGLETGLKGREELEKEGRKFAQQKELETFKTDEAIRLAEGKPVTAKVPAPSNKRFVDAGGNVTFVNVNDPAQVAAAEQAGLAPEPKEKAPDADVRELKIIERIDKQVTRAADNKFGKPPQRLIYDELRGTFVENTAYPFAERESFINERTNKLYKSKGIEVPPEPPAEEFGPPAPTSSDVALQDGIVEGLQGAPGEEVLPTGEQIPLQSIKVPVEILDKFNAEGLGEQGFTIGEKETTGKFKGQYKVFDENGNLKGYYE